MALAALALAAGPAAGLVFPDAASAHALQSREDLPIPPWLAFWGAALVLIVSFGVLSVAWTEPKLQEDRWRPSSDGLSRLLVNPVTQLLAGLFGVLLLGVVVYSGLRGTDSPAQNFSLTFVFVTFWLGTVVLSVLFGDVFRALNPWRAIARAFSGVFRLIAGQSAPPALRYPERLGHWPAVVGIVLFVWIELIYGSGLNTGLDPHTVAVATLVYSAFTFIAMALFGIDTWVEKGETFSVYFRMFSKLSPVEVRDGRLGFRRPVAGAASWGLVPGSLGLVLATIGTTTYDGGSEGLFKTPITDTFGWLQDLGFAIVPAFRINGSIWMLLVIAAVGGLYMIGVWGMHTVKGSPPLPELARSFAHTLIPIALAYLIAHYFSLLVFQEQAQFTYLLSDPLGNGHTDLFGTASSGVNYGLIGSKAVWYVQIAALIAGHVTALTLAHDRALAVYGDVKSATRSQYWMLVVMVCYTCLAILLLSQANG